MNIAFHVKILIHSKFSIYFAKQRGDFPPHWGISLVFNSKKKQKHLSCRSEVLHRDDSRVTGTKNSEVFVCTVPSSRILRRHGPGGWRGCDPSSTSNSLSTAAIIGNSSLMRGNTNTTTPRRSKNDNDEWTAVSPLRKFLHAVRDLL